MSDCKHRISRKMASRQRIKFTTHTPYGNQCSAQRACEKRRDRARVRARATVRARARESDRKVHSMQMDTLNHITRVPLQLHDM